MGAKSRKRKFLSNARTQSFLEAECRKDCRGIHFQRGRHCKTVCYHNRAARRDYFHAITFSDVKSMEGSSVWIYAAPLVLWLISLIFAVMVLVRKKYGLNINSSRDSKEKFEKILEGKYKLIRISGLFLILSFVALTIALLHYLGILSYQTFEMWHNSSVQLFQK